MVSTQISPDMGMGLWQWGFIILFIVIIIVATIENLLWLNREAKKSQQRNQDLPVKRVAEAQEKSLTTVEGKSKKKGWRQVRSVWGEGST